MLELEVFTRKGEEVSFFSGSKFTYHSEPKSWPLSQLYCKNLGGYLASIQSIAELEDLNKIGSTGSNLWKWIGGNDEEEEGTWRWTDESEWSFTDSMFGKLYQYGKIEGKSDIHDCMQFHYPKCFYDESAPMLTLSTA